MPSDAINPSEDLVRASEGFHRQGNLIGDGDAEAFHGHHFARMVGEDADVSEAEVNEDLRADAALALDHALKSQVPVELAASVQSNARERARGRVGRFDGEAAAGV